MSTSYRLLAVSLCALLTVSAFSQTNASPAVPITGSASFFGSASASGPSGGGLTNINYSNNWIFLTGIGLFAGLPQTPATFNNFSFTGDGIGVSLSAPIFPLWSFTTGGNTYSFDLLSLSSGHTEAGAMAFTGAGTLHTTVPGFDPTPASFAMNGTGNNFQYTLSFVTNTAIPEPSSIVLAGFGLALCGAVARFRCRKPGAR